MQIEEQCTPESKSPAALELPAAAAPAATPASIDLPKQKPKKYNKRNSKKGRKGRDDVGVDDDDDDHVLEVLSGSPRSSPKGAACKKISARQFRRMGDKEEYEETLQQVQELLFELKALDKNAAILKYTNWDPVGYGVAV